MGGQPAGGVAAQATRAGPCGPSLGRAATPAAGCYAACCPSGLAVVLHRSSSRDGKADTERSSPPVLDGVGSRTKHIAKFIPGRNLFLSSVVFLFVLYVAIII